MEYTEKMPRLLIKEQQEKDYHVLIKRRGIKALHTKCQTSEDSKQNLPTNDKLRDQQLQRSNDRRLAYHNFLPIGFPEASG